MKQPFSNKSRRPVVIVLLVLVGILLLTAGGTYAYLRSLTDLVEPGEVTGNPSLQESDLIEPAETVDETDSTEAMGEAKNEQGEVEVIDLRNDPDVYNILLIGSDRRGTELNGRSDSMIIFSINKRTKKIHLVSLMRALYVNIPGREFGMLNASFSYGGSKLLRQTIEDNLRVRIDDYIMIDFSGFQAAIDKVGGIDISLTQKEVDFIKKYYGTELQAGENHLDGRLALAYSRIRYIDSDYARTGRQRKVIELLLRKAMNSSIGEIDGLAREILPLVKTNLSGNELISLAISVIDYRNYEIKQLMLPVEGSFKTIYVRKMEMVQFDFNKNITALHSFIYDD